MVFVYFCSLNIHLIIGCEKIHLLFDIGLSVGAVWGECTTRKNDRDEGSETT